jgi:hypothetical protein
VALADELLAALNDPTYMWSHALKESSPDSQRLFLAMALLPQPVSADDLQIVHSAESASRVEPFIDSLRTLEDSFIKIEAAGYMSSRRWINFRNPSLQDFAYQYLDEYSDWLDTLLSSPVYYEQIAGVYNLAMAHSPGSWTEKKRGSISVKTDYREGPIKFQNIRQWVVIRHKRLMIRAFELAISDAELNAYHYVRYYDKPDVCNKLKELLEILKTFGMPASEELKAGLSNLVTRALEPTNEASAKVMIGLLRVNDTAEVIRAHSSPDAMKVLRRNILDKDTWKFALLSQIDSFLRVDYEDSMADWGEDYVSYAEEMISNMPDESDYGDYTRTIGELQDISSYLGIDLQDSISALEAARAEIPDEDESGNYENYNSESKPSRGSSDPLGELDRIFSGLLE